MDRYAGESVNKLIVGTKGDLIEKAQVTKKEVLEFCHALELECMWISSKEDKNVNEIFYLMMEIVRQRLTKPKVLPVTKPKPRDCTTM